MEFFSSYDFRINLFIVKPFKREPTNIYYYEDKCMECGFLTKEEERHKLYGFRSCHEDSTIETLGSSKQNQLG